MNTCVSKQNIGLNVKKKFTAGFQNKKFGFSSLHGKVDRQKLFHFSENTNNYGCHGNFHMRTFHTSIVQFFSL